MGEGGGEIGWGDLGDINVYCGDICTFIKYIKING